MKVLIKSALSTAVALALATTSAQGSDLIDFKPDLKLTYKNYYWKQKDDARKDSGKPAYYRDEWVQGLIADFDTGYFLDDKLGAVITAGTALPISVKRDEPDSAGKFTKGYSFTNIAKGSDGKANAVSGLQQAYLKGNFDLSEVKLKASLGIKKRNYSLYGNSGSRVLAASSRGADLSATIDDLEIYTSFINGASSRNASTLAEKLTVGGKKLDHIAILGAKYHLDDINLNAEHLLSKDYLKKTFVKAVYTRPFVNDTKLEFDARFALGRKNGDLAPADFNKSSYYNLNAKVKNDDSSVLLGYSTVQHADWEDGNGQQGNSGHFNSTTSQWASYSKKGEKAIVVEATHKFAEQGLPGLSADAWVVTGRNADNFVHKKQLQTGFKRHEFGAVLTYSFDDMLKGLKLKWLHVNLTEKSDQKTLTKDNSNRFYVIYSRAVF